MFQQVLLICDAQGLIRREMFAIDGVKLPSNASKERSGTRADFQHQAQKMEAAVQTMLERHREADTGDTEPTLRAKEVQRVERLGREARRIREWLAEHPEDRQGSRGAVRKSNRTDNDSAKMATSKAVIQGYTGVAAVDAKHQVIVDAQAHGTGSEQELLLPTTKYKQEPDPLHDKGKAKKAAQLYGPQDFNFDREAQLRVPGRQAALWQWAWVQDLRLYRHQVPRQPRCLRALHAARQMPAHAGQDQDVAGGVLHRQATRQERPHRTHEAGKRSIDRALAPRAGC